MSTIVNNSTYNSDYSSYAQVRVQPSQSGSQATLGASIKVGNGDASGSNGTHANQNLGRNDEIFNVAEGIRKTQQYNPNAPSVPTNLPAPDVPAGIQVKVPNDPYRLPGSPDPSINNPPKQPTVAIHTQGGPGSDDGTVVDTTGTVGSEFDGIATTQGQNPNPSNGGYAGQLYGPDGKPLPTTSNPNFDPIFTDNHRPVVEFQKRTYIIQPVYDVRYVNNPIVINNNGGNYGNTYRPINSDPWPQNVSHNYSNEQLAIINVYENGGKHHYKNT